MATDCRDIILLKYHKMNNVLVRILTFPNTIKQNERWYVGDEDDEKECVIRLR